MIERLYNIRRPSNKVFTVQQKTIHLLLVVILGVILGVLAKYADGSTLVIIGTEIAFWVLVTTLIAVYSRSPLAAALHTFAFLGTLLVAYYFVFNMWFGFFPKSYFIAWGIIALLSPIGGFAVWFSKGEGWLSAFCASVPISVLLVKGTFFFRAISVPVEDLIIPTAFELLAAVLLFILLPPSNYQRLRVIPLVVILYYVIKSYGLLGYLPA